MTLPTRSSLSRVAVLAIAVPALVAACSSGGGDATIAPATGEPSAAAPTSVGSPIAGIPADCPTSQPEPLAAGEKRIVTIATDQHDDAPLARYDGTRLTLASSLPAESRRFLIAHRLAALAFAGPIAAIVADAPLAQDEARRLLATGLANYAAGALLMPYHAFRTEARRLRHDIERLARRYPRAADATNSAGPLAAGSAPRFAIRTLSKPAVASSLRI